MSSITVVTNRHLCEEAFLVRIERLLDAGIDRLILREKDMTADAYLQLAEQVMKLSDCYDTECVIHSFAEVAKTIGCPRIHLPIDKLDAVDKKANWQSVGVSVHSVREARTAVAGGADYLIAGHIFATACKAGLAGRGIGFLQEVCAVGLPVHAIGGIGVENVHLLRSAGICVMSSAMRANNPKRFIYELRRNMVQ